MKKYCILVVIALLAIVSSVSAQTCDCEGLQAQIDELQLTVDALVEWIDTLVEEGKIGSSVVTEETAAPAVPAEEPAADVPAEEPAANADQEFEQVSIKGYTLDYVGYELAKSYDGKDYIKITFHYTNNSDASKAYVWALSTTAFQDGIELKDAYVDGSETSTEIRPGKSIDIIEAFYLRSMTEPIELEFDESMSWDDSNKTIRFLNIN